MIFTICLLQHLSQITRDGNIQRLWAELQSSSTPVLGKIMRDSQDVSTPVPFQSITSGLIDMMQPNTPAVMPRTLGSVAPKHRLDVATGGRNEGLVVAVARVGLLGRRYALTTEVFGEWARHAKFMRMSGLRVRAAFLAPMMTSTRLFEKYSGNRQ